MTNEEARVLFDILDQQLNIKEEVANNVVDTVYGFKGVKQDFKILSPDDRSYIFEYARALGQIHKIMERYNGHNIPDDYYDLFSEIKEVIDGTNPEVPPDSNMYPPPPFED